MNKDARQKLIQERVNSMGKVSVNELSFILSVTPETIRRDLDELEGVNALTRIHGAAIPYQSPELEMIFEKKLSVNREAKRRIARKALEYIEDGDTIAVDVGTTTVHMGDLIEGKSDLLIVTNSLAAAQSFSYAIEEERITGQVFVLPGTTHPSQASIKGSYTVDFLKRFYFDRAFISCGGVLPEGVFDYDMEESLVSTIMMECSQEVLLLTDGSKLKQRTLCEIAPMSQFHKITCECEQPSDWYLPNVEWVKA